MGLRNSVRNQIRFGSMIRHGFLSLRSRSVRELPAVSALTVGMIALSFGGLLVAVASRA